MGKRIATALVLIPLVVVAVWYLSAFWFAVTIAAVAVAGAWEWAGLVGLSSARRAFYCLAVALVLASGYALLDDHAGPWLLAAAVLWWMLAAVSLLFTGAGAWWWGASGVVTLFFGWYGLVWLRQLEKGPLLVLFLLVLIWIADSAAYFSGRRFGRRKLAPRLSPGKTIEGLAGGISAATGFALVAGGAVMPATGVAQLLLLTGLCALVVLTSVVGDLFESALKRGAGVKDSGHWLPGHGGVLDRIDSLLAAAPVFAAGIMALSLHAG